MRGFGATTGVASLLIFFGEAAPSLAFGFCFCSFCNGGGGGGGGGTISRTSNTWIALSGLVRSTVPETCKKAKASAAWIATTAATAPPLSLLLRSDRYITASQRRS